ncbi:unnamed protein product [Symbiodinium natans]|uniref:Uncharacterized protein n=1 Tax=Symbiodinium natans TaxID=878477 RepID=A0A812IB73_9DINO|nr:unnamed protein product [Symbiodinium natans]
MSDFSRVLRKCNARYASCFELCLWHVLALFKERLDSVGTRVEAAVAAEPVPTTWEWTILNPNAKFKANCGCPLVSTPFSLAGFEGMRAIFTPGTLWLNAQPKDPKKQRKEKVWPKACRYGSLQLKFSERPNAKQIKIYFTIGSCRLGPLAASVEHCTSQVCELSMDWRSHIDKAGSALTIGVEVWAD